VLCSISTPGTEEEAARGTSWWRGEGERQGCLEQVAPADLWRVELALNQVARIKWHNRTTTSSSNGRASTRAPFAVLHAARRSSSRRGAMRRAVGGGHERDQETSAGA
jgi:hypothetical protein